MYLESKSGPSNRYLRAQVVLHWSTALLVLLQFAVNDSMRLAFRDFLTTGDRDPPGAASFHLVSGLLILILTLIRLVIRLAHGAPPHLAGMPPLFKVLASLVQGALYAFLVLMPLTGAIAWFGGVELGAVLHETGRLFLLALILAHVLGALVEQFVFGRQVIRRML
jgi:cytochrome b561